MKRLILLGVIAITISGCMYNPKPAGTTSTTEFGDYTFIVIDSCEYIEYQAGMMESSVYSLTHKGNCKFCKERNSK